MKVQQTIANFFEIKKKLFTTRRANKQQTILLIIYRGNNDKGGVEYGMYVINSLKVQQVTRKPRVFKQRDEGHIPRC